MPRHLDSEVVVRRGSSAAATTLGQLDGVIGTPGLGLIMASLYGDEPAEICPVCGWSVDQAKPEGLMGCGACYEFIYPAYQDWLQTQGSGPHLSSPD